MIFEWPFDDDLTKPFVKEYNEDSYKFSLSLL